MQFLVVSADSKCHASNVLVAFCDARAEILVGWVNYKVIPFGQFTDGCMLSWAQIIPTGLW